MSFEANYHGTCTACREHINPGDLVRYESDQLVHADCSEAYDAIPDPPKHQDVCPKCWLVKPCDCD